MTSGGQGTQSTCSHCDDSIGFFTAVLALCSFPASAHIPLSWLRGFPYYGVIPETATSERCENSKLYSVRYALDVTESGLTGFRTALWCRSSGCAAFEVPPWHFGAVSVSERSLWVPEWWTLSIPPAPAEGPGTLPYWHMHLQKGHMLSNSAAKGSMCDKTHRCKC